MAKLTKPQIKAHREAEALIDCDRRLHDDEKVFILDNWQESATHINSAAGAFFTPSGLAGDLSIEVNGSSCEDGALVDLCAGIGALAFYCAWRFKRVVCVEINPEYARIGKRILPEAEWIVCSAFEPKVRELGRFAWAISNPPFGRTAECDYKGPYTGAKFEYKVIETASRIADFGAFIIPQMSAPFRYSGERQYREEKDDHYIKFHDQTGIGLEANCGIDTSQYKDEWRGVSPACEIVVCEFEEPQAEAVQMDLLDQESAA